MNKQKIIGMVLIFLLLVIIDKGCNRPATEKEYYYTDLSNYDYWVCYKSAKERGLSRPQDLRGMGPYAEEPWTIFMNKCAKEKLSK